MTLEVRPDRIEADADADANGDSVVLGGIDNDAAGAGDDVVVCAAAADGVPAGDGEVWRLWFLSAKLLLRLPARTPPASLSGCGGAREPLREMAPPTPLPPARTKLFRSTRSAFQPSSSRSRRRPFPLPSQHLI